MNVDKYRPQRIEIEEEWSNPVTIGERLFLVIWTFHSLCDRKTVGLFSFYVHASVLKSCYVILGR